MAYEKTREKHDPPSMPTSSPHPVIMRFILKKLCLFATGTVFLLTVSLFFSAMLRFMSWNSRDYELLLIDGQRDLARSNEEDIRQTKWNQPSTAIREDEVTRPEPPFCNPRQQNFVCIKVHKAASTTTAAILERYGWRHNMSLAVPPDRKYGPHILTTSGIFKRHMVKDFNSRKFNMLTNHARYNREEMGLVVPNATYMAIIRHPVKHFESAFGYFGVSKVVYGKSDNISKDDDPITAFMEDPYYYWNQKFYFWFQLKSGQIFDLGLGHEEQTGSQVARAIQKFDKEFDLIMIADFFDESLLLLRKHLCLSWSDIMYIPDNFRAEKKKRQISESIREKIEVWNWADMALYQHFNRTFWQKISKYGADFNKDLQYFRQILVETRRKCTKDEIKRKPGDAHGVMGYVLKDDATDFCKDLMLGDTDYTKMFRDRQNTELL